MMNSVSTAIVCDWLVSYAGAERVLKEMLPILPNSQIYAVIDFLEGDDRFFLEGKSVRTSFLQKAPFIKKRYKGYIALMPLAVESIDVRNHSLVISSSHAVAKGVITGPDQLHISYVHSPIRYAWDLQHEYLAQAGLSGVKYFAALQMLSRLRQWDLRTANGVDCFVANSKYIARRIWKTYRREADVIYPPVDTGYFDFSDKKENFFLTASRLVPYKRVDLIVRAFREMKDLRLVVVGDGSEMAKIKELAVGCPNIEILGYQSSENLKNLMRSARAFVFAAEEDFGITPVEAQSAGTPVIAFGKGGAAETIISEGSEMTGVHFAEQEPQSVIAAIRSFIADEDRFTPAACRVNAERFSKENFSRNFSEYVNRQCQERNLI